MVRGRELCIVESRKGGNLSGRKGFSAQVRALAGTCRWTGGRALTEGREERALHTGRNQRATFTEGRIRDLQGREEQGSVYSSGEKRLCTKQ